MLVLSGGSVWTEPDAEPIADGVVIVRDGVIAAVGVRGEIAIPDRATVLDCTGGTVTAGFWNCHVHFFELAWADAARQPAARLAPRLEAMLTRRGFTSVFDLGSPHANTSAIRARIECGEIAGPRIHTTGEALLGPGWMPPAAVLARLGLMAFPAPELSDAASARAAAQALLAGGADGVKLFAARPSPPFTAMPEAAMRAVVEVAHRHGRLVFVHPTNGDGLRAAVCAGVDVIAHTTPQSGPWDAATLAAMRQADVALIPTLKLWRHQLGEAPARLAVAQLRAWVAAGGTVLFGTDVGGMSDQDPGEEYALMAAAGMTPAQILAALTTAPAERFGAAARSGRIAPGLAADLVVIDGDPARDVGAFARVRCAARGGAVVYQRRE